MKLTRAQILDAEQRRLPSLSAVARATTDERTFSFALRDFLDGFRNQPTAEAISEEAPLLAPLLGDEGRADAYLAAVCDHLCRQENFRAPAWCREPCRTLEWPFFAARSHPMRMLLLLSGILCAIVVSGLAQTSPPLGSRDFYPSNEQPIGWRGNGTGAWPGATPLAEWNAETGENIVWKTPMPGPSFSQPIVVGDKVFTLADPNWLICVSAADGSILWKKAVDHTAAMPQDVATRAHEAIQFWEKEFLNYAIWLDLKRGLDPKLPWEEIDRALAAADEHEFAVNAPGQANFDMIKKGDALWDRAWSDQTAFSLYYFGHWEGILTHTFPTRVSDGQSVFVNMANDQIASYDLDGNCRWLIRDRPKNAPPAEQHVRYAMSPQLIGDRLIVAACGELRAYDKATGKKLWGVWHKTDFGARWGKVSPPVAMRLALDGQPFDVLLSPGSGIYRLSDGKLVGTLPPLPGYEGSTALTDGDIYVRKDAPDSGSATRLAGRLKAISTDEVTFDELWRTRMRTKSGNTTDVLFEGWIYCPQDGVRIELATGKGEKIAPAKVRYCSPALGGKLLVSISGGGFHFRDKIPGVMKGTVTSLESLEKSKTLETAFVDRRYLEDQEFRLRWRWRGNADTMSHSSPSFQANRMFFRTAGYLWCIGDPQQSWLTPASAPAAARVKR